MALSRVRSRTQPRHSRCRFSSHHGLLGTTVQYSLTGVCARGDLQTCVNGRPARLAATGQFGEEACRVQVTALGWSRTLAHGWSAITRPVIHSSAPWMSFSFCPHATKLSCTGTLMQAAAACRLHMQGISPRSLLLRGHKYSRGPSDYA